MLKTPDSLDREREHQLQGHDFGHQRRIPDGADAVAFVRVNGGFNFFDAHQVNGHSM